MGEREQLIIANLLNGVPAEQVAASVHDTEESVLAVFQAAMRCVAEYQLVHCVPYFAVGSLAEARRERLRVLGILASMERWDAYERDLVLGLLKGQGIGGHDQHLSREEVQAILSRTLDALPNYLPQRDLPEYFRDRKSFVATRRKSVIEAVERFVSLDNPLTYKRIEHLAMDQNNALDVVSMIR